MLSLLWQKRENTEPTMRAFPVSSSESFHSLPLFFHTHSPPSLSTSISNSNSLFFIDHSIKTFSHSHSYQTLYAFVSPKLFRSFLYSTPPTDSTFFGGDQDHGQEEEEEEEEEEGKAFSAMDVYGASSGDSLLLDGDGGEPRIRSISDDGAYIEIDKIGKNTRRIRSRITIGAPLAIVWNILTDYERLADFIPGLAVSRLLQKGDNYARLYQIGQQNLAFGFKFNAKGIIDCYEKEMENLPSGKKRDIEFKMTEGDFQIFEGKWSILQADDWACEGGMPGSQEIDTTLSYIVDVKPKLWLPVRLIESRLCNEIKMNLASIRVEARRVTQRNLHAQ